MQFETEEGRVEKAGLHPGSIRTDCGLSDRPGNSSVSPRAQLHPLLVLVLSPALYTKGPGRSHVDPKVACEPASAPLGQVQEPLEVTS